MMQVTRLFPLQLLIQQIGRQSRTVCMANAPADANAAGPGSTLSEPLSIAVPRMQGKTGMFLFCVLKIIPITRCVPWPGIVELEF